MPTKRPTPGKNSAHAQRSPRQSTRRGTSASYRPRAAHATRTPTVRVTEGRSEQGIKVPAPGGGQVLLTRRHFLYGAIGIGALAVVGGGIGVGVNAASKANEPTFNTLTVSKDAVTSCSAATPGDFTEIEDSSTVLGLSGTYELPYGTLVWASNDSVAACLVPTDGSKPLTKVVLLSLSSGNQTTAISQAKGQEEGFEIYDVRACATGIVWTEANILDGTWRIYSAGLSNGELGTAALAEEGGADWETPTLAASSGYAFWQVLPKKDGSASKEASRLMRARFGSSDTEEAYTSKGRMCTPPYATGDSVVITPRAAASSSRYQLTRIDAQSASVVDSLVLPSSMKPLEAGYGDTGFMFSFEAIYNFGEGIANLGTYIPASTVQPDTDAQGNASYSLVPWFRHGVTPTAPPAWCGGWIIAKDSYNVCGFSPESKQYFMLEVKSGAPSFGDYLASTGSVKRVVTYSNIDNTTLQGESQQYCCVRVWEPA